MNQTSRTKNALKNTTITIICHILYLLSTFICRTIFTKRLGAEYLGINGLFSNVLTILSFAELGLGSSLVYHLYKPLNDKDNSKVQLYMNLYKKIYRFIILSILVLGIGVIPFLKYFVQAPSVSESLVLLYILHLLQTITSYVFVYKKTLLTADQKDYVVTLFTQTFNIIMNVFQCIFLLIKKDFVIYCILNIIFSLLGNLVCSLYVAKKYPYLNKKVETKLSKEEINAFKTDAKGLIMTKVASTAFSGTDNIFISSFIGINYVGILSNYTLILTTINNMMNKVFGSITATVGNLAVNEKQRTEAVLKKMFFLNTAIYSYVCIGLLILIGEFVTKFWLDGEYFLSNFVIISVILELYIRSIHYPLYTTRNALGLFSQYRIVFILAALLNIVLDFLLVKPLGIAGLFIATIICRGITYIVDIYVVYKFGFETKSRSYYLMLLKWSIFLIITYFISYLLVNSFVTVNIFSFILKMLIITVIYLILFIIFFFKSEEMEFYKSLIYNRVIKKRG